MPARSSALLPVPRYTVFPDIPCSVLVVPGDRGCERSALALDRWAYPPAWFTTRRHSSFDANPNQPRLRSGREHNRPGKASGNVVPEASPPRLLRSGPARIAPRVIGACQGRAGLSRHPRIPDSRSSRSKLAGYGDYAVTETLFELDCDDVCPVFWVNSCCNVANAL
jgi:hypothetical protein